MDPVSLASALAGAQMSSAQMAVAAKMVRMNADNAACIVEVINAAQRNIASLPTLPLASDRISTSLRRAERPLIARARPG